MAKSKSPQVIAKASKDNNFPKLKTLTHKEMYNVIAKFIRKAVPIKGNKLTVVNGLQNRVSEPKAPYILLQITDQKRVSSSETYYTDQYKILFARSQLTVNMSFVGTENVTALQMAHAFVIRFNDSWASEEFIQYSDDLNIDGQIVNSEDQVNDICSVNSYFEYHPELGVCEASAK